MRKFAVAVVAAMTLSLLPAAPSAAQVPPMRGVRISEVYRASVPLKKGLWARITVERYFGSGYTTATPVGAGSFIGCLTVTDRPYYSSYSSYYPSYGYPWYAGGYYSSYYYYGSVYRSICNELDVMTYEFDPQMKRMRVHFDLQDTYGNLPPASVNLVVNGSGGLRNRTPTGGLTSNYDGSPAAWAHVYGSRRAASKGWISMPGIGKRSVKPHSPMRGLFERRIVARS